MPGERRIATDYQAGILIVDDHPIVRRGLGVLISLEPNLNVCAEASNTVDALVQVEATNPDIAVIDLSFSHSHGIELIKDIKSRFPSVRMLVCSMHDESLFAERALRAGAMGYINKAEATECIVQAIRQVLDGHVYLSPRMSELMLHRMLDCNQLAEAAPIESLSDRELEVFEMIGRGLTTRRIADDLYLSPKTIETYRENIKRKLNLANGSELTRHAVEWVLQQN